MKGHLRVFVDGRLYLPILLVLAGCFPPPPPVEPERPSWISKRPYIADPSIIEGVGATDPHPSIEVMRERSRNVLIQEISLQTAVTDSGYAEDYLRDFREYYSELGRSAASLERIQLQMRNNILKYITFAEEWQDHKTGQYWRYGWMVKAADEINALETAKEDAAKNEEIILDFYKNEFMQRIENRIKQLENVKLEQEEQIREKLDEAGKNGS